MNPDELTLWFAFPVAIAATVTYFVLEWRANRNG